MARRDTGFPPTVVLAIVERDRGCCARCGTPVDHLERGVAWSIHHRRARGMGGARDAWINEPANGAVLCGSGVTGCHGWVEKHRDVAYETGWLIRRGIATAETVPLVHALHGYVLLNNMGGYERLKPTEMT